MEESRGAVGKLIGSNFFAGAPQQRKLIEYIGVHSIEGRHDDLIGTVIAAVIFQKRDGCDDVVRASVSRLRKDLKAYYADEGYGEDVMMEIPRGHYIAEFIRRPIARRRMPRREHFINSFSLASSSGNLG